MSSDYAFLDEIWGPLPPKLANPACETLAGGKLDNIMDAYISQETRDPPPAYDVNAVEGYNATNPLYSQSFGFDQYYTDELKNIASNATSAAAAASSPNPKPISPVVQEEQYTAFPKDQIYKDIIEKYSGQKENSMIELVAFIAGGIFLIFFMEQILQIGSRLG
jgi:hypothetical protein